MSIHYVGEPLSGGVVFHHYVISGTDEVCLIVSTEDVHQGIEWSDVTDVLLSGTSSWDGETNTGLIVGQEGHTRSAALECRNYSDGGWYLPSVSEMNLLEKSLFDINRSLANIPGSQEIQLGHYWTSTEFNEGWAYGFCFDDGRVEYDGIDKYNKFAVRAIKKVPC
jgi:hypothetical protein